MYACLAVTCHLHFWQNDRDFLRATVVTRGWNGYRNKSQHRKSTLEKKILPPFQQGFEPATFQSRVRCSNHWAIPTPSHWSIQKNKASWDLSRERDRGRETDRQTDRQTDWQTDRQTVCASACYFWLNNRKKERKNWMSDCPLIFTVMIFHFPKFTSIGLLVTNLSTITNRYYSIVIIKINI